MPTPFREDLDLTREQIQSLSSAEALAAFFAHLRYPADTHLPMTTEALGLSGDLARSVRRVERLASVEDGALEIYLFELKSVTVTHTRVLARNFRDRAGNYLLILTDDYDRLDFVLLERILPGGNGQGKGTSISRKGITIRPRVLTVDRRNPDRVALRVLRRFTFTEFDLDDDPDPYAQYDKLQSAYTVAEWSEPLFNNRALFSDYYLNERLPNLPEWDDPVRNQAFRTIRGFFADARRRFAGQDAPTFRQQLVQPLLETLGFRVESGPGGTDPNFRLFASDNPPAAAAFALAYPWDRYLDGKDETRDTERPEENPGAQVVSLLEAGQAPWAIVTNGKIWRLYSARAHSRATNYYEIDLEETLASPDASQAFRYFYLFFRATAFTPTERLVSGQSRTLGFLDWLLEESATYAQELGERLKEQVFEEIFPHFAEGFIQGLGGSKALLALSEDERTARLDDVFQGTLTFLYRLLFLLYAESRDLLPVREVRGYYEISLQHLKEKVAAQAKTLEDQAPARLKKAYTATDTTLYDHLLHLFCVIDQGDRTRNVPIYNGGLFLTDPDPGDVDPDAHIARFLLQAHMPDRYLALGLDRLARDLDPKRGDLVFIDYKSLGVRQLGSIYEGLLEFKVRVAEQKMAVVKGKKAEEIIPHAEAKRKKRTILTDGRGAQARPRTFRRGTVYLENDRHERKATGSYYTPDYIVKYIVLHTVGPVLDEKFEALRPRLRQVEKRFRDVVTRKKEVEKVTPDRPALLTNIAGDVLRDFFDVKVLDPAMGSGHFLVQAVDYITDRMVRFLDGFPFLGYFFEGMRGSILAEMERQAVTVDPARLTDVTLLKRHVLKRCIYGVDLNRMAVELAKVSLWLDCFTLGAPLSFLDHHLRWGNSLIGTMTQAVDQALRAAKQTCKVSRQAQLVAQGRGEKARQVVTAYQGELFGGPFAGLLRAAEIMRGISFLTDVTLTEVHQSEQLFREFDRAAKPYKQLLDVYVARDFGVARADEFLRLYGTDAIQAGPDSVGEPYATVLRETHRLYEEKRFFHWDLEFPEVFIDLDRADWKQNGGFDAVVGNPPYSSKRSTETKQLMPLYRLVSYRGDPFAFFVEKGMILVRNGGQLSFIIPATWTGNTYYKDLRRELFNSNSLKTVVLFDGLVFEDANVDTSIIVACKEGVANRQFTLTISKPQQIEQAPQALKSYQAVELSDRFDIWPSVSHEWDQLIIRSYGISEKLSETTSHISLGLRVASVSQYTASARSAEFPNPLVLGNNVERYEPLSPKLFFNSKSAPIVGGTKNPKVYEFHPKILVQSIRNLSLKRRLVPTLDETGHHFGGNVVGIILGDSTISALYLLALLSSQMINEFFAHRFITISMTSTFLGEIPIRRIYSTTSESERQQRLAELIIQYEQGQDVPLLDTVEALLPKGADGNFLAFAPGATGDEENSDIVHDLLTHLAQQMIDLNKQKQVEQKRFLAWLEAALQIHPDKKGRTGLNALTGKTKIFRYLGDYQKGEPEPPWATIEDVLFKNKRRLGVSLNDTRLVARLRAEYEKSLDTLRPIKAQLARTDRLIDQVVYRLYGLTEEEIAVVEGRPEERETPMRQRSVIPGKPRSIARESDPRVLAQVIETLGRYGPSTTRQLSAHLSERNLKLEPDKARTIQREFQFLDWLESETGQWSLTTAGKALTDTPPTAQVDSFARQLALANEQHNQQVVSRLLQRMWNLNPAGQGAVILPQPPLGAVLDSLTTLQSSLLEQFPRWSQSLQQQMAGFVEPETFEPIVDAIVGSLTARWEQMRPHERRNRILTLITERFVYLMFGHIMTPSDVEIWQGRLDWAGLTHTARHLPGLAGQVWFPVGAFRPTGDDAFTPVEGLASQGLTFHRFIPAGSKFEGRFNDTLYEGYREQQRHERVEYVSLLAVRDWVCYRLRISHDLFESTLQEIFPRALRGDLKFTMALEVDITPAERRRLGSTRPIVIDNIPRYIIAMRAK